MIIFSNWIYSVCVAKQSPIIRTLITEWCQIVNRASPITVSYRFNIKPYHTINTSSLACLNNPTTEWNHLLQVSAPCCWHLFNSTRPIDPPSLLFRQHRAPFFFHSYFIESLFRQNQINCIIMSYRCKHTLLQLLLMFRRDYRRRPSTGMTIVPFLSPFRIALR